MVVHVDPLGRESGQAARARSRECMWRCCSRATGSDELQASVLLVWVGAGILFGDRDPFAIKGVWILHIDTEYARQLGTCSFSLGSGMSVRLLGRPG